MITIGAGSKYGVQHNIRIFDKTNNRKTLASYILLKNYYRQNEVEETLPHSLRRDFV